MTLNFRRVDSHPHHAQAAVQVVLPQLLVPLGIPVSPEDVVDEDVEPALLPLDPSNEVRDFVGLEVIDS